MSNTPAALVRGKAAKAKGKRGKGVTKSLMKSGSIFNDLLDIVPKKIIKGFNKAKLETACDAFLKSRNLSFESYAGIRAYFAQRPTVRASMLLITADRPWELDFECLSKVLLPGRLGMAMVRAIYGRDKLIDALVKVCIFLLST